MMRKSAQLEASKRKIARVFRLARKERGLSQIQLASVLGVDQAAISRIESGRQELGATDLVIISQDLHIATECFSTGYLETMEPTQVRSDPYEGSFKIPSEYRESRASKVRNTIPFLNLFRERLGEKKLQQYLETKKLDPDFFYCLDKQINIRFSIDLYKTMLQAGVLNSQDLSSIAAEVPRPSFHGLIRHRYEGISSPASLLTSLIANSRNYEANFSYELSASKKNQVEITATPGDHLGHGALRIQGDDGRMVCDYKAHYFKNFSAYNQSMASTARVSEQECFFKGAKRCVYRLNFS